MTQEEKQLLLKDLCARLPYGVFINTTKDDGTLDTIQVCCNNDIICSSEKGHEIIDCVKPYLRPMSSMTEEEFINLTTTTELQYNQLELVEWDNNCKTLEFYLSEIPHYCIIKVFDWLNAHHFDYRGLIGKGLAIKADRKIYVSE